VAGYRSHEPQEPMIYRNAANKRGLHTGSVEPPSGGPSHIYHLLNECSFAEYCLNGFHGLRRSKVLAELRLRPNAILMVRPWVLEAKG